MTAPQTPNMFLTVPVIGQTLDPQWATYLNQDLYLVDNHDHSPGKGALITPAAFSYNADLSAYNHALLNASYVSFYPQLAAPTAANTFYWFSSELWLTNGAGAPFQMTTGSGTALALPAQTFTFPTVTTAISLIIPNGAPYSYVLVDTTNPIAITLPAAVTASNRFFWIKDFQGAGAGTNNITVFPSGADTIDGVDVFMTMDETRGACMFESDGVSSWSATFLPDYHLTRRIKIDGNDLVFRNSGYTDSLRIVNGATPRLIYSGYLGDGAIASVINVDNHSSINWGPGSVWKMFAGSSAILNAVMGVSTAAGQIAVSNLGTIRVSGTGKANIASGGEVTVDATSAITVNAGLINFTAGVAGELRVGAVNAANFHGITTIDGILTVTSGSVAMDISGGGSYINMTGGLGINLTSTNLIAVNGSGAEISAQAGCILTGHGSSTFDGPTTWIDGAAGSATLIRGTLTDTEVANGHLRVGSGGSIAHKFRVGPDAAIATLYVYDGDRVLVSATSFLSCDYILSNTGAENGNEIHISMDVAYGSDNRAIVVKNAAGIPLITLQRAANKVWCCKCVHTGAVWKLFDWTNYPPLP